MYSIYAYIHSAEHIGCYVRLASGTERTLSIMNDIKLFSELADYQIQGQSVFPQRVVLAYMSKHVHWIMTDDTCIGDRIKHTPRARKPPYMAEGEEIPLHRYLDLITVR